MASRLQSEIKQSKPFESLRQEAMLQLARTAAALMHAWEQAIRVHGLTATQYNVLRILRGAGATGLCRNEISRRLVTQVPDVSRLLDRMTRAGLVRRARGSADRRMVHACITEAGLSLLEALQEESVAFPEEKLSTLSDTEVTTLIQLLEGARSTFCKGSDSLTAAEEQPEP